MWISQAMSKKVILTIIALVLVATLSGIGISCKSSHPTQFVTHTDERHGFSIDYPKGWDIVPNVAHVNVLCNIWENKYATNLAGVQVAKYSERVAVSAPFSTSQLKEAVASIDSFSALLMKGLPDNYPDYVPASTEKLTINGIPAIKHAFTGCVYFRRVGIGYAVDYKYVQVYLVESGVGWALHFSSPAEDFDSHEFIFDAILHSFRLLK